MKVRPLVTIIMLTRNRAKIILRSINSVLQQDYDNFEFLIMDASDNEDTLEIVNSIRDNRIRYTRVVNETSALNTLQLAIDKSRGEYIAFNDDDDEWISPQKLSKQVELIELLSEDYGVVYCWWEIMYDDTGELLPIEHKTARGNVFKEMLYDNAINGTPTLLIKKKVFYEIEGILDQGDFLSSDYYKLIRISEKFEFDFVPEVLVRCHERHGFGSLGRIPTLRYPMQSRINLQLELLNRYKEAYIQNDKARRHKYEIVIAQSISGRDYVLLLRYLLKHLIEFRDVIYFSKILMKAAIALISGHRRSV